MPPAATNVQCAPAERPSDNSFSSAPSSSAKGAEVEGSLDTTSKHNPEATRALGFAKRAHNPKETCHARQVHRSPLRPGTSRL